MHHRTTDDLRMPAVDKRQRLRLRYVLVAALAMVANQIASHLATAGNLDHKRLDKEQTTTRTADTALRPSLIEELPTPEQARVVEREVLQGSGPPPGDLSVGYYWPDCNGRTVQVDAQHGITFFITLSAEDLETNRYTGANDRLVVAVTSDGSVEARQTRNRGVRVEAWGGSGFVGARDANPQTISEYRRSMTARQLHAPRRLTEPVAYALPSTASGEATLLISYEAATPKGPIVAVAIVQAWRQPTPRGNTLSLAAADIRNTPLQPTSLVLERSQRIC